MTDIDRGLVRIGWILLAIAIVAVVHHATVATMVAMWGEEHHTQSYLVPPLFAYLLWTSRHDLAAAPDGSGWLGVAGVVVLTLLWMVSKAISLQIGVFVSVVLLVSAVALAFIGLPAYRRVWFPLAFWLASVPFGSEFIPQLMDFTAGISEVLLKLTGVAFYRQAKVFVLPGGTFEVAEVCAGLRYLSASVTLAVLYCYLHYRSWWRWVAFVGATVVAFILANGIRAAITMWVSSETAWHDFTGPGHVWMGRILFFLVIVGLFWAGRRYSDLPETASEATVPGGRVTPMGVSIASGVAAVLVVAAAPAVHGMRTNAADRAMPDLPPPDIAGCVRLDGWPATWTPEYRGPDRVMTAGYDCGGTRVGLYVASYFTQDQGKELASEGNRILPVGEKEIAEAGVGSFAAADGRAVPVNVLRWTKAGATSEVWSWYGIGAAAERSDYRVKLRETVDALLFRRPPSAAYVVVAIDHSVDAQGLEPVLERAASAVWADGAR